MKPTDQQLAIFDAAAKSASMMVVAFAGTGKTTTIEHAAQYLPKRPTLGIAFNKRIQVELESRLPDNFTVKTMNGLGHGALAKAVGGRLIVESNKIGGLVTDVSKQFGYDRIDTETWTNVRKLVNMARQIGLVPSGMHVTGLIRDDDEVWEELADSDLIELNGDVLAMARETLRQSINQGLKQRIIDYDDQIYLSTIFSGLYTKYGTVIVDEAQDLSPLNHLQVRKSLLPNGKLIVVGDPRQAIYAFRGADSASMGNMRKLREEWIDLPLSVTFRCPKVVVARQQNHAKGYVAAEANIEGTFTRFDDNWTWGQVEELAKGRSIAVLCRNNAPIISLAFKLIRDMIGVNVLGRDIGKNIANLLKKICGKNMSKDIPSCLDDIERWASIEIRNARAKEKDEKIAQITDRQECMLAVIEAGQAENLGHAVELITALFADSHGKVTLSTGHKAKGFEWNTVVHLDPWRIPSKYAKQAQERGDDIQMEQELNLKYVIETRAQENLINASLEGYGGKE